MKFEFIDKYSQGEFVRMEIIRAANICGLRAVQLTRDEFLGLLIVKDMLHEERLRLTNLVINEQPAETKVRGVLAYYQPNS